MAYTKQEFVHGQTLTANHLNHIEDGVAQLDTTVSTVVSQVTSVEKKTDALTVSLNESNTHNNTTFSNSIKGTASGATVTLSDVSPIEHVPTIRVHGKNLWKMQAIDNTDQLTVNDDGTVTVAGGQYYCPTYKRLREICPSLIVGMQFIFSINTNGAGFIYLNEAKQMVYDGYVLTATELMLDSVVVLYGGLSERPDFENDHVIQSIQLEYGNVRSDYTSYISPTAATVTVNDTNVLAPDSDGHVPDIVATYPTMTLKTNNENYVVSVSYNRDATAVINDLLNRVHALENPT